MSSKAEQLIPSVINPTNEQLAGMDSLLERERAWYADEPRFHSREDIFRAIGRGTLTQLHQSQHLRPIARFAKRPEGFDPYLTSRAWRFVHDFAESWRTKLQESFDNHSLDLRLAVTSMVRHQTYQNQLVQAKRYASIDSTHCTGNAVDIDVSGYYHILPDATALSYVDPRRHKARMKIADILSERLGNEQKSVFTEEYCPSVTVSAIQTAREFHDDGAINLIEEFAGTENACLHIAVNPDY